jgi:hypothetical protein
MPSIRTGVLRLAAVGWVGLGVMLVSEAGMLLRFEPFYSWHTPIAWTGYVLFVDALVRARRGSSWLSDAPLEFAFLALASVPLWLVFEFYNRFIQNWHYINLPENATLRILGYAWSFATIWPAIFESADLVASLRRHPAGSRIPDSGARSDSRWAMLSVVVGAAMLIWPIVRPSPYLAAPVWLGFIFLLDPLNARIGAGSLLVRASGRARYSRILNLCIAGLMCGFVWEFWNYWARTKWIYTVPILPEVRLFEMPLPGYLGFPAFALECFVMYATARWLLWRGPVRAIGL